MTTEQSDVGAGDGDNGGLSWLTKAAGNPVPSTATPTGALSAAEPGSGSDWLSVAKSSGQTKSKPRVTAPAANATAAPASPGGWMSSGKLGISTEDDSDQEDAGEVGGGPATATAKPKKKKKKKTEAASAPSVSGRWLGSGALGVPAGDESDDDDDDDDESDGGGGRSGVGVTIETQTEDDIEAFTEGGAIEKENAPKLPPWAKPWVPPPKPEVVPDVAPEVTSALTGEADKQVIYCRIPTTQNRSEPATFSAA